MKAIKTTLKFVKSTKGTHVYGNEEDGAPLRSQYINRASIDGEPPQAIVVTIEAAK
jgi:hypothetical protein